MRVLMFGWEFPPHISGGLGTACHGLIRGLTAAGVEVLLVVPKAYGDEAEGPTEVIGANHVTVRRRRAVGGAASTSAATADSPGAPPSQGKGTGAAVGETGPLEALLQTLSVPSYLEAYTSPEAFAAAAQEGARAEGRDPATASIPPAVAELRYLLTEHLASTDPGRVAEDLRATAPLLGQTLTEEYEEKLEFAGSYTGDLMAEVARYALAAASIATRNDFDVVHAHDWLTYPAGLVAAAISGKPLVAHIHATEFDRSGEHVNQQVYNLEAMGFAGADRVVAVSHFTASIVRRRYNCDPDKIRVVHNAVIHSGNGRELTDGKSIPEPIVLFLGRVTFQKGPDYFLEAAAKVVKVEPRVKFVMSGSGDMLPKMIEHAARLGIARNVHFTGFLRGKDVERMYAMADLYVMPSVSEPFGITPLEAMALDVPVIVSRQSGVSEVLEHALKCDFWDTDDLANKILALLRRRALRQHLISEGRDEVARLRWEEQGRVMAHVYEEVSG